MTSCACVSMDKVQLAILTPVLAMSAIAIKRRTLTFNEGEIMAHSVTLQAKLKTEFLKIFTLARVSQKAQNALKRYSFVPVTLSTSVHVDEA